MITMSNLKVWAATQYARMKRGLRRPKRAWGITLNFLIGVGLGLTDLWIAAAVLVMFDLGAAWYHGGKKDLQEVE